MNLICGINPVLEALSAGTRHFDRLLVVKGIRNQRVSEAVARATQMGVPLRFEPRETLDRMAGGLPHQGVIAVVSPKPVMPIEDLLREAHDPGLVVVLDGVEDPRNLGAILRSAEAAGADGVLLPDRHNAGLSETVSRASAGALEHVKVARIGNVSQAIESLKARGFWVVGFDAEGRERWDAVDYKRSVAVVLGGEGKGMRRLVRERCDHVVSLPLFGHVTSLNVSVVAGIALYEILRQRGVAPSHVRPIPHKRLQALEANVGPGPEDREHDPGRHLHAPAHHHRADDEGDESFVDDGEEEVRVTGLHDEEVAWAGPTVMKADEQRARRGDGRNDRRRDGRRSHKRPQGPPRETPPEAGPEGPRSNRGPGPGPGAASGRRRRGRGRGRGGQPPPAPGAGGEPEGPPRPQEGGGGAAPEGPAGVPPQGHRRRRRRRR
jgi:23S rRNA (guanosine2251-2'-O)-methyltransferase